MCICKNRPRLKPGSNSKIKLKLKLKPKVRALLFNQITIIVLAKYSNYSNIFLIKNIIEFLKYIKINDYTIKLKKSKQLFFSSIYSLKLVELETLKTYIKINLANSFI